MKRSLLALAVLGAFTGAVSAQTSVTLYGNADVWAGVTKNKLANTSVKGLTSGGYNGSRWGLRGSEDLGGGMSAIFQLEQGFNLDDGSPSSTRQFHRQAYVGLAGGFGQVRLGRQYTALDTVRGGFSAAFDTTWTPVGNVWALQGDYAARGDNTVSYLTPSLGGLTGHVTVAAGEGNNANKITSFAVSYGAGPFAVALSHQQQNIDALKDKHTFVGGRYALGAATIKLSYNKQAAPANVDVKEWQGGVDFQTGAYGFGVGFAQAKISGGSKSSGFGATAFYDMSKRTRLYVGVEADNTETAAGVKFVDGQKYGAGVRHWF